MGIRQSLLAGLALPTLLVCAEASAQPSSAPDETSATSESDEIVITAQRREQRLEDVPMGVTAISDEALEAAGIVNIQELGRLAPGVQVGFAGAFTAPSVRGVTTVTNANNFENNVAIYIDGFYEPNTLVINQDLANLSSIEVLKGPQGTLYGRNATGGAILINTLAPSDVHTGKFELTYARFNDKRMSAYLSGPLTEGIRYSIAGYNRDSDGYIKLINPEVIGDTIGDAAKLTQRSLRTKLEIDVSQSIMATLAYNYAYTDDPRGSLFSTFDHLPAGHPAPPLRPTELGTAAYNHVTTVPATTHQGTLKLEFDAGIGKLTSYTGYTHRMTRTLFDFDGTWADQVYSINQWKQDTWQQAADFVVTAVDKLDLVIGGAYFKDDNHTTPVGIESYAANRRLTSRNLIGQKTEAWAVYVDATYQFTDALSLNVGGRYSHETKENDFSTISYTVNPAGIVTVGPINRKASFSRFTPRASIRFEIAPRTNIYASYSEGFRSGTFNSTPPSDVSLYLPVKAETIRAYEVGFKTARRNFRFDAAAYYYDYKDLQVVTNIRSPACPPLPAPCGLLFQVLNNAPKSEIYGFEAQAAVTPVENLDIRAGLALVHARFKDFPNAIGTGVNPLNNTNQTQLQDWSGQQLARAPDFTANIAIDYNIPMGEGGLQLSGNASYTDSYVISNLSLFGSGPNGTKQRFRQSGYALFNASATWTDSTGHFWVGLFTKNLANKKYRATYNGGQFGDYSALAEPRTYGVRAGFRF